GRRLVAKAVFAHSPALAAELEGSWLAIDDLPAEETSDLDLLPRSIARAAARAGAEAVLVVPVRGDERPLGTVELFRSSAPFDADERAAAQLAAAQVGL